MRRILAASAAMLILPAGAALAQIQNFDAYDTDVDGLIEPEEFDGALDDTGVFDGLDTDGDDFLSREELDPDSLQREGPLVDRDVLDDEFDPELADPVPSDPDRILDMETPTNGLAADGPLDGRVSDPSFGTDIPGGDPIDTGRVGRTPLDDGFEDEFDTDGDGLLSREEFGAGTFEGLDADASGALDDEEFGGLGGGGLRDGGAF